MYRYVDTRVCIVCKRLHQQVKTQIPLCIHIYIYTYVTILTDSVDFCFCTRAHVFFLYTLQLGSLYVGFCAAMHGNMLQLNRNGDVTSLLC